MISGQQARSFQQQEATSLWLPRPREVEFRRERLPELAPGTVHVKTVLSALSHGTEMLVYRGQVPPDLSLDLPTLQGSFRFPIKYGYATVGWVAEAGEGVESPLPGELVFVHHPHQTEYVVPASMAIPLPPGIDPEVGCFVASLETAVNVMLDCSARLGERVVVFGQGVVGLLLTQLARRAGAGLIATVDPLEIRRRLSLELGADMSLSTAEGLQGEILRCTGGMGADVVLEVSGNGEALNQALELLAFQGTLIVCSWYGLKPVTLDLGGAFHRKRLRLISSQVSSIDPALQPRWDRLRRLSVVLGLLPHLQLKGLITQRIPFERAQEAYDLVERHPEETVQVILTYGEAGV